MAGSKTPFRWDAKLAAVQIHSKQYITLTPATRVASISEVFRRQGIIGRASIVHWHRKAVQTVLTARDGVRS